MNILPRVGGMQDVSDGPWTYIAVATRDSEDDILENGNAFRLVVDTDERSKAIALGRSHFSLLSTKQNTDFSGTKLVEDWAYSSDEAEFLQWEAPETNVIETDGVTIIERKSHNKD